LESGLEASEEPDSENAMSIIDQDLIDVASTTFEVKFQEIFEHEDTTESVAGALSEDVTTESEINEVDLLGTMPVMRKWIGAKQEQVTRAYSQSVTLEKYESTLALDRMKVRYDKTGLIGRRIERFLQRNKYWREKMIFDLLVTNPTAYDGVSFFSASHPHGPSGATQSNTTTSALSVSTLDTALVTMSSFRDENGESLGISGNLLVVGPKLRKLATELTGSTRLAGINASNVIDGATAVAAGVMPNLYFGGTLSVLVWPRYVGTYDDYWTVIDTAAPAKPMILYIGRQVEAIEQVDMNGEFRFINDKLRWSLEADAVPAPGAWQTAYGGLVA
jgi:phage major head subunit gpT-like protein